MKKMIENHIDKTVHQIMTELDYKKKYIQIMDNRIKKLEEEQENNGWRSAYFEGMIDAYKGMVKQLQDDLLDVDIVAEADKLFEAINTQGLADRYGKAKRAYDGKDVE